MAEQTTPTTGSPQAAQTPEQRIAAFLSREPAEAPEAPEEPKQQQGEAPPKQEAQQPEGQAPETDELTPDDLPEEATEAQQTVEEFEIVHNGQQRKLSREETIRLAQQGFDYTQKTQQLAEAKRHIEENLQRSQEALQLAPLIAADLGSVRAFEAQLMQYQNVDWVRLATDDPLEYPKHRAAYDQINAGYQAAVNAYNQKAQVLAQRQAQVSESITQTELPKLIERIPEWSDPEKRKTGSAELRSWLIQEGAAPQEVDALNSALAVSIARKAMLYDKLLKSKASKVKQLREAPPVTKPGAQAGPDAVKADQARQSRERLRKSGSLLDAAAVYLNRMK